MIDQDKANHALVGASIAAAFYLLVGWWAVVPCVLAAVGKEVYDSFHKDKHTPDVMDTVWTLAGSGLVLLSHLPVKEILKIM